jgi:hypothetical protein
MTVGSDRDTLALLGRGEELLSETIRSMGYDVGYRCVITLGRDCERLDMT